VVDVRVKVTDPAEALAIAATEYAVTVFFEPGLRKIPKFLL
jgi:hypothetical protein